MRTMQRERPIDVDDRPVRVVTVERRTGRGRTVSVLVLGLIAGGLLAGRLGDVLPGFLNPFRSTTVDQSQPALLEALSDLSEFHAASAQFQVPIDVATDVRFLPDWVAGERTTFLAVGTVDASVSFAGIGPAVVVVSGDADDGGRFVSITLPPAELSEATVDPDQSMTLDRDRGIVNRVADVFSKNPGKDREMFQLAEEKLEAAAAESGLVERAEDNTRAMLQALVRSLGFQQVYVSFTAPAPDTAG